jgi:putative DNA primase/helicase
MALPKLMCSNFAETANTNPDLVPIRGGNVVDLKTGLVRQRTREDMFSFERPVSVVDGADVGERLLQIVDQFMLNIANGDHEMKAFIQKMLGYCLTGHTHERVFFIWWGKGANGKSRVSDLMKKILGAFYGMAPKDVFIQSAAQNRAGAASPHLVPLIGVRMAVFSESSENEKLNAEQIKSLSGNDTITYRELYCSQNTFTPVCKLIMQTNHKPTFYSKDVAVTDRIRLVPFLGRFVDNPGPGEFKRDAGLVNSLENESLDAVFTWVLRRAVHWNAEGLGNAPAVAREEMDAYLTQLDDISRFVQDRCEVGEKFKVKASELYSAYTHWAKESTDAGVKEPKSITAFGTRMKELYKSEKQRAGII